MVLRYTILWLPMVIIGIVNGALRNYTYGKCIDELHAHQISTLTGIIFFGIYVWLVSLKWKIESPNEAIIIGLIWLALTVSFEFLFGHFAMKHEWSRLLADYNIFRGRLWLLVLIWITIAPYIFHKIRS
jgi:hypothetical protein